MVPERLEEPQPELSGPSPLEASGQRAWPRLSLGARGRALFREKCQALEANRDPAGLSHADDLFLACACAEGNAEAVRLFEACFAPHIEQHARLTHQDDSFVDDVKQRVLERLFVAGAAEKPKIVSYSGRGTLRAWLSLVTRRLALDLLRPKNDNESLDDVCEQLLGAAPPIERELFRRRYQPLFVQALRLAFSELAPRERALLRLATVDGLSHAKVAEMFDVTQPTITRWLSQTREQLAERTRILLAKDLGVPVSDTPAIVESLISRMDLSLTSLLMR